MSETLKYRGCLVGHTDWVTAIATPVDTTSNIVLSSSRYVASEGFGVVSAKAAAGLLRCLPESLHADS